jgi:outer membrane lipoprotein SlyB
MVASLCGIGENACGNTQIIGFALGAFAGALIGSALEGDQASAKP